MAQIGGPGAVRAGVKKVLITGATGAIGGRLAETLCARGIEVVALVGAWQHAARLARLQLEMVHGNLLQSDDVRRAMEGCDIVFHCAPGSGTRRAAPRRVNVASTRHVLRAALRTNVGRVVFLSCTAAGGSRPRSGTLREVSPPAYTGIPHTDAKIAAERLALRYHVRYGVPLTILRPTLVYGPFQAWTVRIVNAIRAGGMVLVSGGRHASNAVYVDNLVHAMLVSAQHPQAVGQVFHIADDPLPSWKVLIEEHARHLGDGYLPLPEMTREEAEALRFKRRQGRHRLSSMRLILERLRDPRIPDLMRTLPLAAQIAKAARTAMTPRAGGMVENLRRGFEDERYAGAVEAPPLPDLDLVRLGASDVVYSTEKAGVLLGYHPPVDFPTSMEITNAWIKWARL